MELETEPPTLTADSPPRKAAGEMIFTGLERVVFGQPAAQAAADEAARLGARRVFLVVSRTLNHQTRVVRDVEAALGLRHAGTFDGIPAHAPREAVVACAAAARTARADLLLTIGGGSVADAAKIASLCLEHDVHDAESLDRYRTVREADGTRHSPSCRGPSVRLVCIPTTLSGAEFHFRAGIANSTLGMKESFDHPGVIPRSVILDAAVTLPTPPVLFLSTGMRAVDHAVETLCSIDANPYTDGMARQALRLLGRGLAAVAHDGADLAARMDCLMGAWISIVGLVAGTRMGASHAIGHILGGAAAVPHGVTSCVMLPAVLAFNAPVNARLQDQVSAELGRPGVPAAIVLEELITALGLPRRLRDVGVAEGDLPRLAAACMRDPWTASNPRPIHTERDVHAILREAY